MKILDSVALVTGANRGLGRAIVNALVSAGARKVYACARDPKTIDLDGVIPVQLDITKPAEIAAAAGECGDVNLLVNNAGIAGGGDLLAPDAADHFRRMFETNVLGTVEMTRAFAPVLARNGGGAVVDILSVLSWLTLPNAAAYSASKAAAWSVTNAFRSALRAQGTRVVGVHIAFMDTDMTAGVQAPKTSPRTVADMILSALESGEDEVLADAETRRVKSGLSRTPGSYLEA